MTLIGVFLVLAALAAPAPPATHTGAIRVHVDRHGEKGALDVLAAELRDDDPLQWTRLKRMQPDASDVTVDDVPAGAYAVMIRGRQPLERLVVKTRVSAGAASSVAVVLPRRALQARFLLGAEPLAGSVIRFTSRDAYWDMSTVTGFDGSIAGPLWSEGDFDVAVNGGLLRAAVVRFVTLRGSTPSFVIDIPNRRLRGRVADARGKAVVGALVVLQSRSADRRTTVRSTTGHDGTFEYAGLEPGHVTLNVIAPGFVQNDPIGIDIAAADTDRDVPVVLDDGFPREVAVMDGHSEPRSGALVVCAAGGRIVSRTYTQENGRAFVPTPRDRGCVLYVLPREGSIAVRRLSSPMESADIGVTRIIIAPATASLRVETLTTDGTPIPDIALLMRVDGEMLPLELARDIERQQGAVLTTASDGAARLEHIAPGVYELWPYATRDEAEELIATASMSAAPITVNVTTGENVATVRFARRQ